MIEKNMEFPLSLGLQKTGLPLIISSDNLCFLIDTGSFQRQIQSVGGKTQHNRD